MAIAGKVAITLSTENGGAWSADVTYDRLVAVKHNNNLYISRKTVTNVEPPNDEFWFLAMEGFSGEDIENIIDGTTQVGNAKTLDGHGAEDFATLADLENHTVPVYTVNNEEELLNKLAEIHANAKDNSSYEVKLNIRYSGEPLKRGGSWSVQGFRHYADYGWQSFSHYSGDALLKVRVLANNTWSKVYTFATLSDLANYLPLTGGTVDGDITIRKHFPIQWFRNTTTGKAGKVERGDGYLGLVNYNTPEQNSLSALVIEDATGDQNHLKFEPYYGQRKTVFHEGNKPTGTYTGNGSATKRVIETGGIGKMCIINDTYHANASIVVLSYGAFGFVGKSPVYYEANELSFTEGRITIATDSPHVNFSGADYQYEVH